MNMTELKKYIESGKLDEKLVLLYGEKSLDAQRKRWMGAVDGFIATYGKHINNKIYTSCGSSFFFKNSIVKTDTFYASWIKCTSQFFYTSLKKNDNSSYL